MARRCKPEQARRIGAAPPFGAGVKPVRALSAAPSRARASQLSPFWGTVRSMDSSANQSGDRPSTRPTEAGAGKPTVPLPGNRALHGQQRKSKR